MIKDVSFLLRIRYPGVILVPIADALGSIERVETESPDLLIVEAPCSNIDTLDLISSIRDFSDVPLIVISESQNDVERAKWLEAGADDYVSEPLNAIEFLAKVRALLRRTERAGFKPEHIATFSNGLVINFNTHEVFLSGKQVKLTPTEFRLLSELANNRGKVLTHRSLLDRVWGPEYLGDASFTKKYIYRLRRKLDDNSPLTQELSVLSMEWATDLSPPLDSIIE